jgi:hypothetical protein
VFTAEIDMSHRLNGALWIIFVSFWIAEIRKHSISRLFATNPSKRRIVSDTHF